MKCDTVTLVQVIDKCLDYALDGRLKPEQRAEFLALAKRMRGSLLNLVTAKFEEGTKAVEGANANLTKIINDLGDEERVLSDTATTVKNLAQLAGMLDELLKIAVSFV